MGTDAEPWAYDNERPAHVVDLAPFRIGTSPSPTREYAAFVESDGYADERLWSDAGWAWRREAGLTGPLGWHARGRRDLHARSASASAASSTARRARRARLLVRGRGVRPMGGRAAPDRSGVGGRGARRRARRSSARVWEWTASDFLPTPGSASFPYPEYSEVFFGDEYKVLRGGSWATHPVACRTTFRNWDYPIRRQIFSGFRLAADAT